MRFIKDISWEEVFSGWRMREAGNPGWIHCATEVKGWPDWESWRRFTADRIKAGERDWELYEFTDPMSEIPAMLVGPYSGWQSKFPENNKFSFDDLLDIERQYDELSKHEGVLSILDIMPFSTEFIGIVRKDNDKIICLEGHHRATAVALAKKQGKSLDFSVVKMNIALTDLPEDEIYLLNEMLARGTSKEPRK